MPTLRPFSRLVLLLVILSLIPGCGSRIHEDSDNSALVQGRLPVYQIGDQVLLKNDLRTIELPVDTNGSFAGKVLPGTYQALIRSKSGTLKLIEMSLTVEDNLTINLLNASLVPIPRVISVSVPLVYEDSAVVEWETDIDSDGRVDYGVDTAYGYSSFTDPELTTRHRIQLYGLSPNTSYHFRVVASRHSLESVQTFSPDYVFVTENRMEP